MDIEQLVHVETLLLLTKMFTIVATNSIIMHKMPGLGRTCSPLFCQETSVLFLFQFTFFYYHHLNTFRSHNVNFPRAKYAICCTRSNFDSASVRGEEKWPSFC